MRKTFLNSTFILLICSSLFIPSLVFPAEKLSLGMVGSSPSKLIKRFTPLLAYLNEKGIPTAKVVVAKNLDQMIQYFESGKADFFFESAYGALKIMDATGAVPILIREKKGVRGYNSVIFVKKDSPVQELADLKGKVIAFEDPTSTSSYILPQNILLSAGLELKESRKPIPGAVAYYFSKDDDNTLVQVKAGKRADAGGIKKSKVEKHPDFRMLSPESVHVPRHVVMVRKGVPNDTLKAVLLKMKNDPEAATVLEAIVTPGGFSEFQGDAFRTMDTTIRKGLGL